MDIIKEIRQAREFVSVCKAEQSKIALVPTMGALHSGHLSLIEIAKNSAEKTVASIFVNPLQFNNNDDLENYPRTLDADLEQLRNAGVDAVFVPDVSSMCPEPSALGKAVTKISAGSVSDGFCGASRMGHFDGVVTIVASLFNIWEADFAVFGEKDYQQLKVIEQMVHDLHFGVKIIPGPLVRDELGLALSSRNARLSKAEYNSALAIPESLFNVRKLFFEGQHDAETLRSVLNDQLSSADGVLLDYANIVNTESLEPLTGSISSAQILVAAFIGPVRLIDNLRLES